MGRVHAAQYIGGADVATAKQMPLQNLWCVQVYFFVIINLAVEKPSCKIMPYKNYSTA